MFQERYTKQANHDERPALLHVIDQEGPHDNVTIIGTPRALKQLIDVLEQAIKKGHAIGHGFFVADGEGFDVEVRCKDADWQSSFWQENKVRYQEQN